MSIHVDVWLRGNDFATTQQISGIDAEPRRWTDTEVRALLEGMLQAMDRSKHPAGPDRPVVLRGLSWIVNPYEGGGVVIAVVGLRIALSLHVRVIAAACATGVVARCVRAASRAK